MSLDVARLHATLGTPELAWLVDRLKLRLERGQQLGSSVTLRHPTREQRSAIDRFLGRPPTGGEHLTVRVEQIEQIIVNAGIAADLRSALDALVGPIVDRMQQREHVEAAWADLFSGEETRLAGRPEASRWLAKIRNEGILKRLAGDPDRGAVLLRQAAATVDRLPATPLVTLARLAADVASDAHALDAGAPLGTLVIRFADELGELARETSAEGRRRAWLSLGVVVDQLSAPVLVLNLPGDDRTLAGRALQLHAEAGEPFRLSTRLLMREAPQLDQGGIGPVVYVCENPTVVAVAADQLGRRCAPLVCLEGQPATAARLLLEAVTEAGIALVYHGDFDWPGMTIANLVMSRHSARPWRLGTADYVAAAASSNLPLDGRPVCALWDATLEPTMSALGVGVHEEQVLDILLRDLDRTQTSVR